MQWAALIAWVLTAGGGFTMLALWLKHGGQQQTDPARRYIRPPLIFGHFALAATGLVLWIIYVIADTDAIAWIAFAVLVPVALLGFTMFVRWAQERDRASATVDAAGATAQPTTAGAAPVGAPAEQRFPVAIVGAHGLLAVTTVVLVLLAAAGVGD